MYTVAYKTEDGRHDTVTLEAPDELTALFRAGYTVGWNTEGEFDADSLRVVLFAHS